MAVVACLVSATLVSGCGSGDGAESAGPDSNGQQDTQVEQQTPTAAVEALFAAATAGDCPTVRKLVPGLAASKTPCDEIVDLPIFGYKITDEAVDGASAILTIADPDAHEDDVQLLAVETSSGWMVVGFRIDLLSGVPDLGSTSTGDATDALSELVHAIRVGDCDRLVALYPSSTTCEADDSFVLDRAEVVKSLGPVTMVATTFIEGGDPDSSTLAVVRSVENRLVVASFGIS